MISASFWWQHECLKLGYLWLTVVPPPFSPLLPFFWWFRLNYGLPGEVVRLKDVGKLWEKFELSFSIYSLLTIRRLFSSAVTWPDHCSSPTVPVFQCVGIFCWSAPIFNPRLARKHYPIAYITLLLNLSATKSSAPFIRVSLVLRN